MPQRWNAPDFSGIMDSFLRPYLMMKQQKMQGLQDKFSQDLATRQQTENEKYRQYMMDAEARSQNFKEAEAMRPQVVGNSQLGLSMMTPGQLPTTGPYRQEEYNPQFTPIPGMQPQGKAPGGFELSPGQSRFEYDPMTKGFKSVASVPGNPPRTTGGYTRGQAWDDAEKLMSTEAPTTLIDGNLSVGGKTRPPLGEIAPKADSLYNYNTTGQWDAPGQAQDQGEPMLETSADVEAFVQQNPDYQWLLQSPEYLQMKAEGR